MSFSYPKHIRFRCSNCALCCRDTKEKKRRILLLKIEAKRISKNTLMNIDDFAEKIEGSEPYGYVMKKDNDGKCVFLNGQSCSIYQIRPLICRFYPFQLKNLAENQYAFTYTDECIGIGKGPCLKESFFEKMLEEAEDLMKENQKTDDHKDSNSFIAEKDR
ncbi:MAG: YkgJ family cysteine cluster protein [Candidatus Bathyarchaeia archaeon]